MGRHSFVFCRILDAVVYLDLVTIEIIDDLAMLFTQLHFEFLNFLQVLIALVAPRQLTICQKFDLFVRLLQLVLKFGDLGFLLHDHDGSRVLVDLGLV